MIGSYYTGCEEARPASRLVEEKLVRWAFRRCLICVLLG